MGNKKFESIPEIGHKYHFFDDGKTSNSRHYIAECVKIIAKENSKNEMINLKDENGEIYQKSLFDIWEDNKSSCIYAADTDNFICCNVPEYDENLLWFVRTTDGGWFSLEIQSFWQSGRLDVDKIVYHDVIKYCGEGFYTRTID